MPNTNHHDKWLRVGFLTGTAIAISTTSFWAATWLVAKYLPDKAPFTWGMLAGALPVSAIAGISAAQSAKDHREELADRQKRIASIQGNLTQAVRDRDDIQRECTHLKSQIANAEKLLQAERQKAVQDARTHAGTVEHIKTLSARLEVAKAGTELWEKQVTDLKAKIATLEADNQEWEDEFEQRLQTLFAEDRDDERAKARADMQQKYQQLIQQFEQKKPEHIRKRTEKAIAERLQQFETDYAAITAERDRAQAELQQNRADFASTVTAIQEELDQSEYVEQLMQQVEELQEAIERKDKAILELRSKIVHLEQPRRFIHGSKDNRGNIIIDHALDLGIVLDGVYRSRTADFTRETYHFATRENLGPKDVITKLMGNPRHLQADLDAIKPIHFQYNPETLCYEATVELAKKQTTRDDIDRKWLKASKFKALVKNACAFRVSANKGGSKSPTVRNILGAKLLEGEKFKLRRYDPSAGSRKDYWRIAPTWRSYHEAIKMAAEIESLILRRQREKTARNGAEFDWVYYVIDELDNTISMLSGEVVYEGEDEISAAKVVMEAIAKAVKEGEHLQIGIIICTQTPNVRQLMKSEVIDKAFFNNMCEIVVEANVFNYLGSSFDQTKSSKLASDYRVVYDWCDQQNEAIEDEARKYRPALFINKAKREIVELPQLGEFGFDKLEPIQPYDFEEFNAYEYDGARSLDQARLMASKESVARTVLLSQTAPDLAQTTPKAETIDSDNQTLTTSHNTAVAADPKILPKAEAPPNCPICGDLLKPNGVGKKGKYRGMRQLVCKSKTHTSRMGTKTFYMASHAQKQTVMRQN